MTPARPQKERRDIREIVERMSIAEVVGEVVALKKAGREFVGLCPFHQEKTPSFTVSPEKRIFHCFGCGAGGDVIEFIKRYSGCSFVEAVDRLASRTGWTPAAAPRPAPSRRREEAQAARKRHWCLEQWQETLPADGSPVERYLQARGIDTLEHGLPGDLRFHPAAYYDRERVFPAMVAAIRDLRGEIVGIHRTYLAERAAEAAPDAAAAVLAVEGRRPARVVTKINAPDAKKMAGRARGGAVRLTPVAAHLALAEGIETALSVMQETGVPTWAALSLGNLATVALPPEVEQVTICCDSDMKDMAAADKIIARAAANYAAQGRGVRIARAAPGMDFNDMLMARFRAG